MQWLYLIAAILGTVLPLYFFVPFVMTHGLDVPAEFFRQLFQNQVSSAFGIDVFVSSIVLWLLVFSEGKRRGMKNLWCYVLCNLLFGVSSGLPLFLFFRERTIKHLKGNSSYAESAG
jgi:Terpene cyclase DEP1